MQNPNFKRKNPGGGGPSQPRDGQAQVKREDGEAGSNAKRFKPTQQLSSSHGNFNDPRTAALSLADHLKKVGTMDSTTAFFHVQTQHPAHDPAAVLDFLRNHERVQYNETNQVYTWIPELSLVNEAQIRTHIRTHGTPLKGLAVKDLREALPPNGFGMLDNLERKGDILIMRALTGPFKDVALPKLGKKNSQGLKINDNGNSASQRLRTVWWDDVRERGRAGKRVEDEFIFAWDEVPIQETDDVIKLLERENLAASSTMPLAPKISASAPAKKKAARRRPLKITNTHMKEQGIDFTKDYERTE